MPAIFTNDSATAAAAEGPLRLVAALQPLNAAVFVGDGVLQGAADFDYLALAMAAAVGPALGSLVGPHVRTFASLRTMRSSDVPKDATDALAQQ